MSLESGWAGIALNVSAVGNDRSVDLKQSDLLGGGLENEISNTIKELIVMKGKILLNVKF